MQAALVLYWAKKGCWQPCHIEEKETSATTKREIQGVDGGAKGCTHHAGGGGRSWNSSTMIESSR